ncbi:DUF6976 family protein [Ideonella livida]|nr:hypothetical protein [Ideonella livida]
MQALTHELLTLADTTALIQAGKACCIAADEALLRRLPRGNWIGGTIPYFMAHQGGTCSRDQLFVAELATEGGGRPTVRCYDRHSLRNVCLDSPDHGFSVMVLPAFSAVHEAFAQEAPDYPDMYMKPLVGWIAGVHLDDIGRATPQVIDGSSGELLRDAAVVMHIPLPPQWAAHVDIINLFVPGSGPELRFPQGGFSGGDCLIGGQPGNLHDWLVAQRVDTRLPLVADYHGAMVNVSIKALDPAQRKVEFYAPVFADVPYRVAEPVGDYARAFEVASLHSQVPGELVFCCNCILNYAYGNLQGRRTGAMVGPMTFGEIGYQLLNQTMVHLSLVPA